MKSSLLNKLGAVALTSGIVLSSVSPVSAATDNALNAVKKASQEKFNIVWDQGKDTPTFLAGDLSVNKVKSLKDVKVFLNNKKDLYHMNPKSDLTFVEKRADELGMTHYTFMQSVDGVPVHGANFTVHVDDKGTVSAITGKLFPKAVNNLHGKKLKADLSKKRAIDNAWASIDLSKKETKAKPSKKLKKMKKSNNLPNPDVKATAEKAELVVYPHGDTSDLAYHVQLQFIYPEPGNWQIFIDAEDGSVIESFNAVTDAGATTGYGYGVLGDYKELNTYLSNGTYFLYDVTNPMSGVIATFTAENGTYLPGYRSADSNNAFTAYSQGAAVDAHAYADRVYDYYYNTFGRNSYDGNGGTIRSTVHYGYNYNNAFWNGQQMVYGDGDGQVFAPLSGALDVVAHELTHAVTDYSAGLVYQDQSGALNESMSDVFSVFVEGEDYLLGEDVYTPGQPGDALRSLSNPGQYGQPDHMSEYVYTNQDNGGVHTNSGIPNKAGYYTIESVGLAKAEQIYYRALTVYLSPYSNFSDARAALMQAAADLYGYGSEYNAVANAWNNVGVN